MAGAKGVIISITGGEDMRLMEVDEAANHIRELVDPDANIIWGSAFNDSLDGKIRVSVVATGIDSNGEAAPASPATRSFSFAPARAATPAPVAEEIVEPQVREEPIVEAPAAEDKDPAPGFSLSDAEPEAAATVAEEEPMELSQVAATYDDTADELVLDAPESPAEYRPTPASDPAPAEEAPARSIGGGTLFERMSRLSRGASAPDADESGKDDGIDIPRFLGRQNNQ